MRKSSHSSVFAQFDQKTRAPSPVTDSSTDKIRSAARHEAWNPSQDGSMNLNPFGKLAWSNQSSRIGDEEQGLSRTRSEGRGLKQTRQDTERINRMEKKDLPHHANTMPVNGKARGSQDDIEVGPSDSPAFDEKRNEASQESNTTETTGETLVQSTGQAVDDSKKPRRRKMGGILAKLGHHQDEEDSLSRTSSKKTEEHFTIWSQVQHTIFNSWINILLLMAPVGIALHYTNQDPKAVFVVNFIAIIPLAAMLSFATEEIALRTGETIGGLLNATFGNAVELIVSLLALFDDQIDIVQTSLIGSMLSNLLLVMGMCFFFGGLNKVEQHFNVTVAQTAASLLALAIGSLIIPTVYNEIVGSTTDPDTTDNVPPIADKAERLTAISRGTAILLLLVYGCYLYFQLATHASMYNEPSKKAVRRKPRVEKGDAIRNMARAGQVGASSSTNQNVEESMVNREDEEEEVEKPKLSKATALITLAGSTALVAFCAESMVGSIDAITAGGVVSREFVGLILLPIVGNAAEHATAVTVAVKDKMDLAIGKWRHHKLCSICSAARR